MTSRTLAMAMATTFLFAGAAGAQTKCVLQQVGELPIAYEHGSLVVDASINGAPVKMIVDTGSPATSIFRSTAERLGLRMTPIQGVKFYGAGGSDVLNEVGVKEFKVGGMTALGMDFAVIGRQRVTDLAGGLGAGFLFQADVEFDVPDGKLRFFKPVGCKGDQVVYWGKAYSVVTNVSPNPDLDIQIEVKLAGVPIRATLDSGSSISSVNPQSAERYADHAIAPQAGGKTYGIGKDLVDTSVAVFPSFSFGDETIQNARLEVADVFAADREVELGSRLAKHVMVEPQMLLGADFFRSHRVYISKSQRKIYASYMGGPVFGTRQAARSDAAPKIPPTP